MSRGPDAATLLDRAITADAERAGCPIRSVESRWTRWSSATFSGARHSMCFTGEDTPALNRWIAELADTNLPIRGHLVADMTIAAIRRADGVATVELDALTVEA